MSERVSGDGKEGRDAEVEDAQIAAADGRAEEKGERGIERAQGWRRQLRVRLAASAGALLVRLLGVTWRITTQDRDRYDAQHIAKEPMVITLWHGELLPILWHHRGDNVAILISTHADGEIIARVAQSLGFVTVRGSTSRGGARALLALVRQLESGCDVALTPDGPRGPRRVFAPGAAVVAMRAGAPVLAIGAEVDRAWRLRSWDRLVIPKPFARVAIRYSIAARSQATSARGAEAEAPRFAAQIMSVCAPDSA